MVYLSSDETVSEQLCFNGRSQPGKRDLMCAS